MVLKNLNVPGVSVVLVCYNSSGRIKDTLRHLNAQEGISFPWEVVLVDNNSSDETASRATTIWEELGTTTDLVIEREPIPGTMHARRRGIVSARYRYILFCDDDNWLSKGYVATAFNIISTDPTIAAVGGMGKLTFQETAVPSWIDTFKHNFAAGPQGTNDGDTTHDKGCLYTAGTILDKVWLDRLYNKYGFKSILKGRDGKSLMAGEDTELTYAIKLIGGRLFFSSALQFHHYMPSGRTTWNYLRRLSRSMGRSDFLLYPYIEVFSGHAAHSLLKIILVRMYFSLRTFFSALGCFFEVGRPEVLRYDRARGEMRAIFFNLRQMKQSRVWIRKVSGAEDRPWAG